jgi:hypothetical protein
MYTSFFLIVTALRYVTAVVSPIHSPIASKTTSNITPASSPNYRNPLPNRAPPPRLPLLLRSTMPSRHPMLRRQFHAPSHVRRRRGSLHRRRAMRNQQLRGRHLQRPCAAYVSAGYHVLRVGAVRWWRGVLCCVCNANPRLWQLRSGVYVELAMCL